MLLLAGVGCGNMPEPIVRDAAGRLKRPDSLKRPDIRDEAIYRTGRRPGPAVAEDDSAICGSGRRCQDVLTNRQRNGGVESIVRIVVPLGPDEPFGATTVALIRQHM